MFIPFDENIIEKKKCRITGEDFVVTNKDAILLEKFGISAPTLCPTEMYRNLFAFRQEWNLFARKCSKTGENMLSGYREDTIFPVYNHKLWWSDDWSPGEYGRDFDFTKSFFDQYKSLQNVVPRLGVTASNSENCDFSGHCRNSRNCYLCALVSRAENVYYSYWTNEGKNVFDSSNTNFCENIYDCLDTTRCHFCVSCQECRDCQNCYFSYQLKNCQNCIACSGLVGKQNYIYNKPTTPEEFKKTLALIQSDKAVWDKARSVFEKIKADSPRPWSQCAQVEGSSGDHIQNCRDCVDCFDTLNSENLRHVISCTGAKDSMWCYSLGFPEGEMCAMSTQLFGTHNARWSFYCFDSKNLTYSDSCRNSSDLFGCIGMNHGQYGVFNKIYSQQEYETLTTKISDHMKSTGEWGEFFPYSCSPYPYNDTAAMDFYPITESEAKSRGATWAQPVKSANIPNTSTPPLHISQYDERKVGAEVAQKNINTILASIFKCPVTGEPFQIIRQELAFHIENGIPLPSIHPRQRHRELMKLRNPRELFERNCSECSKKIATSYTASRPEKVLCEECYLKLIY